MPTNRFPVQADVAKFYGNPSINLTKWKKDYLVDIPCPWTLYVGKTPVHSIEINKKAAHSLTVVLNKIWDAVHRDQSAIETLHYHKYDGSFNFRPMRGGHALSMHSYGIAIDFDADENQFGSHHALFKPDSLIVKAFEEEGWIWGGHWAKPDNMHFQAARVHALTDELREWNVPNSEWPVNLPPSTTIEDHSVVPDVTPVPDTPVVVPVSNSTSVWSRIKHWFTE